jgi:hypothetical protein
VAAPAILRAAADREAPNIKRITAANYREDKYYPRIVEAVERLLSRGNDVAPVEVFVELDLLRRTALDDWRAGRVRYLEQVIGCNLVKAGRILRILRLYAHSLDLSPRAATYRRAKGRERLRFSKSGERPLEEAYCCHFRRRGQGNKQPAARAAGGEPDPAGAGTEHSGEPSEHTP